MIKAVGVKTRKVYIIGNYREDVMRQMIEDFPSFEINNGERDRAITKNPILPEPMGLIEYEVAK